MKSLFVILLLCFAQYSLCQSDICSLPLETGPCRAEFFRFGFDSAQQRCVQFSYGGCEGNANNFDSPQACQKACHSSA